ncbi:stage III sporulation protein AG [Geomicrobium sp. JCM 19039]|uniref:stage III sporulation protein AG n=1 Tax=Geomicrobium sp. JCM 19039 TaxID=1460636 RepID=UPI00045F463E|nr:stage III sporulation protein AG [Geomicrobium sp. JCM 19039]GAK12798.1 stage III sporulation protein AG [Geomicrobium sp. JCM 19039]
MAENKNPFSNFLPKSDGPRRFRWYYIAGLFFVGVLLMLLGNIGTDDDGGSIVGEQSEEPVFVNGDQENEEESSVSNTSSDFQMIEQAYSNQLAETLEKIDGLSNVEVVVNVKETESKVYEKDRSIRQQTTDEADTEGGNRTLDEGTQEETLVLVQQGSGEEPLLIRMEKPDVSGVLVVANGVESMQRKEWVIEAVTRTLDVDAHRVSVLPKQMGEDE